MSRRRPWWMAAAGGVLVVAGDGNPLIILAGVGLCVWFVVCLLGGAR